MTTKNLHTTLVLALLFALLPTACHTRTNTGTAETQTVTDDYNRTVTVPLHPKRVVSTSPAVTQIIFALGADSLLVGRTDFCTYPTQALNIESIGGISNLNIEKILSLNPDLVLSGSMIPQKSVEQLQAMGVPMVCIVEKQQFDGLYSNIGAIGALLGCSAAADSLQHRLRTTVERLDTDVIPNLTRTKPPSVYYVVGFGATGNFTAGGNTFINDIITMAGGRNIAADIQGWSYSLEALVAADPDYIIVRREDSAAFCTTPPYTTLSAVRRGRVIGIDSGTLDLQVPRNIDAILYLRQRIKPL